jgi:outer membrane protein OmpA-like peptidoglycan-associated protein
MNPRIFLAATAIMAAVTLVFPNIDQHPRNSGASMARNAWGSTAEGAYLNPALLGVDRVPYKDILFPPLTDFGLGIWSNKLHIKPYRAWFGSYGGRDEVDVWREITEKTLRKSFRLKGLNPDQASRKMGKKLANGASIYSGAAVSLFSLSLDYFAVSMDMRMGRQITIPEGVWYMCLDDVGLLPGNKLDLSKFRYDLLWTTDLTFSTGLPVQIPALHDFFKLEHGAGGVGVKYVMGHSILRAQAETGTLIYDATSNAYNVDTRIDVQAAGTNMYDAWRMLDMESMDRGLPINGHGLGIDVGGILYNDKSSLSFNVTDLGVIFWIGNTREVTYRMQKDGLTVYDVVEGVENAEDQAKERARLEGDPEWRDATPSDDEILLNVFVRDSNEFISDSRDTLKESQGFVTVLPLAVNLSYAYTWNLSDSTVVKYLPEDITVGVNYQQQLARGPGRSFVPRLSVGAEFVTVSNWVPVRAGLILGGTERVASTLGFGINAQYWQFNFAYKAVGTPVFIATRGMQMAMGVNLKNILRSDRDKDGIKDKKDKCPTEPEDIDGFEDEDGCPDFDNDKDSIPDIKDKCPNKPEDKDGFEDEDGCPDPDNDKDSIPDLRDNCPIVPEDLDNFEDDNGCPDFDNDQDTIPDTTDKCPNQPEDYDGFEDEDGCPDLDNDKDTIPDVRDKCPNQPEDYDGFEDEDGCPDTTSKPTEKEVKALHKELLGVNFKTGSAALTKNSFKHLDYATQFLNKYSYLQYEIQGHTDAVGSKAYNLVLSAARAMSVHRYLISKGIPDSQVIAIGYGEDKPIASNRNARGRAMNRRVQFEPIKSKEDYSRLKSLEADLRQRVKKARIRGSY